MKTIESEMPFFQNLLKMLKNQFGDDSEFILHDWSKGYDHSIVAIENGHITNRKIGDCGSNLGLEVIRGTTTSDMKCNYVTRTRDGKMLTSSTMYLKADNGETLGALCINTDISKAVELKEYFEAQLPDGINNKVIEDEFFATDVADLLIFLIDESIKQIGKPVSEMTKEDKMQALRYLDRKGALLISKSSSKICQVLEISKFTLYNYLDEIRERNESI
ncbi:MAG: helix-turn-helix transcriptional regulator [Clostridium sp.]|nr:helix-turn-helix transcriptional regulator [Clostridium sp.]